jgi:holo-[acyl-carrier protein] synthase
MAVAGLGLDICSIDRMKRLIEGPRGWRFLERVYTPAERDACEKRADRAAAYAARFAAKEALIKALGAPAGLRWQEMEVVRERGAPSFQLSGQTQAEVRRRGAAVHLALTHEAGVAAAAVILDERR